MMGILYIAIGKLITSVAGGPSKDVDIVLNAANKVSLSIVVEPHILMNLGI